MYTNIFIGNILGFTAAFTPQRKNTDGLVTSHADTSDYEPWFDTTRIKNA